MNFRHVPWHVRSMTFGLWISGSSCRTRHLVKLQNMGSQVIKVENPDGGDLCRSHRVSNASVSADSTRFDAINRAKESIALDLKSNEDLSNAHAPVAKSDIVIQKFRPGVIERLDLGYGTVRQMKPHVFHGNVSGHGNEGGWVRLPGQDLLAQARLRIM